MSSQTFFLDQQLPQQEMANCQNPIYATTDGYITIVVQSDQERWDW